jgi:hypothetical protein
MDRVLLIIDDIQYSHHLEMTLRKIGFDVESSNNEYNINDTVLTFNPEYIICRGNSARLSTLNVGRKLKDLNSKFMGKVVLIFSAGIKVSPEDLIKLKMDLLLFEPISTLRLSVHLFSMAGGDFEIIKDKLLKFAITDNQFRNYEQQLLKNAGITIDSEIQIVSGMDRSTAFINNQTTDNVADYEPVSNMQIFKGEPAAEFKTDYPEPEVLSPEKIKQINQEIQAVMQELPLRIDTYNHAIKKVDQDLKVGLKKRQTKKKSNRLHKDLFDEGKADKTSEQEQDDEKVRFANALFKKK